MKIAISICLFLTVISVSSGTSAQIVESHYFCDTIGGGLDYIHGHIQQEDGIILSGYKGSGGMNVPVVLKIDRTGEVIWSTESAYIPDSANYNKFDIRLFTDGFIYGVSAEYNWPNYERVLWKVNAQNGQIEYTIPYVDAVGSDFTHPIWREYDNTSFYMMQGSTIRRVDKADGSTMQETVFSSVPASTSFEMETDRNGNVYILRYDRLTKYNGNNFNQPLWSKTYTEFNLMELHRIHLDEYGDVFVFGREGSFSAGVGLIMKINKQSGVKTWVCRIQNTSDTDMSENEVVVVDVKDAFGKIYATYQHAFVGGGDKKIITARVNKTNGALDWLSQKGIDNTGYASSSQGRSALSLDVDCDGNIYQTGYYDSDNYQPGKWGSMKLNAANGAKLYEFTVSRDTSENEVFSTGLGAFAYGGAPVFIGHEQIQDGSSRVKPLFVKVSPATGDIAIKKSIGSPLNGFVSTLKVIQENGFLYFLKQTGIAVTVEARDSQYGLIWDYTLLNDSVLTLGGQMTLSSNGVVFSAVQHPSTGGTTTIVTKLDRTSGSEMVQKSLHSGQGDLVPFEVEADNQEIYVFSKTANDLLYSKVTSSIFMPWLYLDSASVLNNYDGEANIVLNKDATSLLVIGVTGMISINKLSTQKTFMGAHTEPAAYYSFSKQNDLIVMCGKNTAQEQILTAKNLTGWTTAWTETYASNGMIAKTTFGEANDLYFAGTENGNINVQHVSLISGSSDWTYSTDAAIYPNARALDIEYNSTDNYLAIAGYHANGATTHAMIQLLNSVGDTIYTWKGADDLGGKSRANTLVNVSGSMICTGGAWNRLSRSEEGFVFYLDSTNNSVNLGLNDTKEGLECSIYPNPATSSVYIKGIKDNYSYFITNLTGQIVHHQKNNTDHEINLRNLCSGAYYLRLESEGEMWIFPLVKL